MKKIRLVGIVAVAAAALLMAAPSWAQSSRLDEIIKRGTLRVGTTGDYKPFTSLDKSNNTYTGFDIDLAQDLAKAMGVKVEFVPTAWPKLAEDFGADKFDMAMGGVSVTLGRAKVGYFTIPYMREGKTPIARCTDVKKFQTIADIDKANVRVIVNPGGTNEAFARANIKTAQITVFPDNTKIFDEIAANRADIMMTDASETRFQAKEHKGKLCSIHPDKPFDFAEKAYWLQRDEPLKQFADQWLHLARENGTYNAIFKKWFN